MCVRVSKRERRVDASVKLYDQSPNLFKAMKSWIEWGVKGEGGLGDTNFGQTATVLTTSYHIDL